MLLIWVMLHARADGISYNFVITLILLVLYLLEYRSGFLFPSWLWKPGVNGKYSLCKGSSHELVNF